MIPPTPKEFDPKSDEGFVFDLLKNNLTEDYYVFHSVRPTVVENGVIYEREIDFLIANKDRGILCLEAKNGAGIFYDPKDRKWKYSSGKIMKHDGPYNQISSAKRTIIGKIENHENPDVRRLLKKCKVCHAVFFFKMAGCRFDELAFNGLPEDCDRRITLLSDDILNLKNAINHILSVKLPSDKYTCCDHRLTDEEFKLLLDSVLCPAFNLIPSPEAKGIAMEYNMNQLLHEQYRLLDFLEDQDTAVINGAAGTGKTMVAVEKARRHSSDGEKVLFLCYNRLLCNNLINQWKKHKDKNTREEFSNVDFMTISEFTGKKTGNIKDYAGLLDWLIECDGDPEAFGYKHVVIDEGQDFGLVDAEIGSYKDDAKANCSIIDMLQEVALSCGGTFYLFYDKYQMIQGKDSEEFYLPDCIQDCDCRLSLTRNCRNTKEIANTSFTPMRNQKRRAIKPNVASSWFEPEVPIMHLVKNDFSAVKVINRLLDSYKSDGIEDVILLTPGEISWCCIADKLAVGSSQNSGYHLYHYGDSVYRVSTCKKFKGLEADAIIMLDLKKDSFVGKKGLNFYVGTSRAKRRLDLLCQLDEADYYSVVSELDPNAPCKSDGNQMRAILGKTFSAQVVVE